MQFVEQSQMHALAFAVERLALSKGLSRYGTLKPVKRARLIKRSSRDPGKFIGIEAWAGHPGGHLGWPDCRDIGRGPIGGTCVPEGRLTGDTREGQTGILALEDGRPFRSV